MKNIPILDELSVAELSKAETKPWEHSFYQLLRLVDARHPNAPKMGQALKPQHELLRLGQLPSLVFAPREIAKIDHATKKPRIRLFGLGMLGPNGSLPIHFTEQARDSLENKKDSTLVNFLDIFHHRYLSFMYRAWAQSQSTVQLDRKNEETFSQYIGFLTGIDPKESKNSILPTHARLSHAPHTTREIRNPEGIEATLNYFFGVPFKVQEFFLHWLKLEEEDCCKLGEPRLSSYLGQGAVLGKEIPDCQSKFKLTIGPMSLENYMRFTPNGEDFLVLVELVRSFIGYEFIWEVELIVKAEEAHPANTSGEDRLGWSTWLGEDNTRTQAVGMTLEPELYMDRDKKAG